MNTFSTRISGTHAQSQTPRLNPNNNAAKVPTVNAIHCFNFSSIESAHASDRNSIRMLRVINNVITPTTSAPVKTDIRQIRQAGFPNGTTNRQTHPKNAHNGYPGGCGTPKLNAPVTNSPESSMVTSGDMR